MDEADANEPTAVTENKPEPGDVPPAADAEGHIEASDLPTGPDEAADVTMSEAEAGTPPLDDAEGTAPAVDESASDRLERIIESVLFASAAPVSARRLVEILAGPSSKEVQAAIKRLLQEYAPGQRGIHLREVAGGYQFRTARENAEWVRAVFREKPARLGRAALETLAIVAYKQPVTRAEIEAIRGVDVDGVLSTLMARRLIKITGRKEAVGRPLLYGTTAEFLEVFGFKELNELPSLKELGPAPDAYEEGVSAETEPQERPATDAQAEADNEADATATIETEAVAAAATAEGYAAEAGAAADGAPTEDPQPGGDRVEAQSGGADPSGSCAPERPGGDHAGNESESTNGSDRD